MHSTFSYHVWEPKKSRPSIGADEHRGRCYSPVFFCSINRQSREGDAPSLNMAVPKYVVLAMAVVALATAASAKTVAVGGAQQWTYGFDYPSWASKIRFSVGDALVFKYSPSGIPHNVYLLKGKTQYLNCDFKGAVLLAGTSAGSPGFKYVLKQKKTYYFACGIGNGSHCKNGSMKFAATPR